MEKIIIIGLILAGVATLGALGFGLARMVQGRNTLADAEKSNKFMWYRIYFQAAALALFALLLVTLKKG